MSVIAYLTSEYPAHSHTFIGREIAALRRKGLSIVPISIRTASLHIEEEVPAVLAKDSVKLWPAAGAALLARPLRALSTWQLALRHRAPGLRALLWSQFHFAEAIVLAAMLRRAKVTHLHCHFANSGATVGMLAAHFLQMPWSLTLHGISETDYPAGLLLGDKLARAEFVACASWFIRAQAMRLAPMDVWSKLRVVRCAVDVTALPELPPGHAKNPVKIVSVGRMSAEKGQLGLIDALAQIAGQDVDVCLTLVGDGPLRQLIEKAVADGGLGDRVRILGALPESETLMEIASCDAFVLPSLMEGLPVVLMEAMALGKPVIAPHIAGIPELVKHEITGLLFRPGDWGDLAEQTLQLVKDPAVAAKMAERGRIRVMEEFEVSRAVDPLLQLFLNADKSDLRDEDSSRQASAPAHMWSF
jgi:glycosyltransferase involved in cell wall biosynthesis